MFTYKTSEITASYTKKEGIGVKKVRLMNMKNSLKEKSWKLTFQQTIMVKGERRGEKIK